MHMATVRFALRSGPLSSLPVSCVALHRQGLEGPGAMVQGRGSRSTEGPAEEARGRLGGPESGARRMLLMGKKAVSDEQAGAGIWRVAAAASSARGREARLEGAEEGGRCGVAGADEGAEVGAAAGGGKEGAEGVAGGGNLQEVTVASAARRKVAGAARLSARLAALQGKDCNVEYVDVRTCRNTATVLQTGRDQPGLSRSCIMDNVVQKCIQQ